MTGLEPAIYGVTGRRDNQLRYALVASSKLQYRCSFVNNPRKENYKSSLFGPNYEIDVLKALDTWVILPLLARLGKPLHLAYTPFSTSLQPMGKP